MRLLSIDIETTGLDPAYCSTLEVGAVLFDPDPDLQSETPEQRRWQTFERLISHKRIQGEPYALQMNQKILAELAGVERTHIPIVAASNVGPGLADWLAFHGVTKDNKVTIVGKNYDAFDRQFLNRLPGWKAFVEPYVERRTLDVGSLYFSPSDGKVESLDKCLEVVGCRDLVTHRALDDALAVATSVSRFFT